MDDDLPKLERKLLRRVADLEAEAEKQYIKQRLLGQIDGINWVIEQIRALLDEPIPLVPTTRFTRKSEEHPQKLVDVLKDLEKAGLRLHKNTDGHGHQVVYRHQDNQWYVSPTSGTWNTVQWDGGGAHNKIEILNEEPLAIDPETLRKLKADWEAKHWNPDDFDLP